jgi:hypothetical protein
MKRRAGSPELQPNAADPFAPLRLAPSPCKYYDLGGSSMVEWQGGGDDLESDAVRRFYSLRDLETRLESEAAVPPALLIFHCGRCGSTLLARLLEIDPANRVFIEPRGLRAFLHANRHHLHLTEMRRDLSVLLRSYGLEPRAGEKRLIIKLTSLAIHSFTAFRATLPDVSLVYLLRNPAEVTASLRRAPPAFLRPKNRSLLGQIIGANADDSDDEWYSRYVAWNLGAAYERANEFSTAIDYREFAMRFLGLASEWSDHPLSTDDPAVAETLGRDSKRPGRKFSPALNAASTPIDPAAAEIYGRWIELLREGRE